MIWRSTGKVIINNDSLSREITNPVHLDLAI
jgi:hypothetical protein